MPYLEVKEVSKHYATHTALDRVSLQVEEGQIFGLLGPNGAGKSSLIRIINRITAPDSGQVLLEGKPIRESDLRHIGYLPEERGLYPKMKVGEQAIYLSRLKGLTKQEAEGRVRKWFERLDILPWWEKKVEELSKGMQQKVQFICTIIHEPKLLIFDEPFSGFDPVNAETLKQEILRLRDNGTTLILSTHNMQSVEELCDSITLIDHARVVLAGRTEEVRRAHSKGTALICYDGQLTSEELTRLAPIEHEQNEWGGTIRLPLSEGEDLRHPLSLLPQTLKIRHAEHEYPSMHEIFLQTVQSTSQEHE
jgi:ABC transporter, ATP-binding protein